MTESEAKAILEAYMECYRRKTEVAYDYQCDKDCEACGLNYEQGTVGEHNEAVTMAIKALEKQIPKKTQNKKYSFYPYSTLLKSKYGECPACKSMQADDEYCANCGQKLDWSDEDNEG